jgi:uncharacterized membrane protein YphA (DoxX/SURF4 family)
MEKLAKQGGRIIYGLPFIVFGMLHLMNAGAMAGMIKNIPGSEFLVYVSGAGLLLAGIAIIINKYSYLAALLLALELLLFILIIHIPTLMNAPDDMTMQLAMSNLLKDFGLMGAALVIAGISKKST